MSSDSSDDEPNLNLLKEACDGCFLNDSLYNSEDKSTKSIKSAPKIASLRPGKVEELQLLDVTPEFQRYVSKRLVNILDKELNGLLVDCKRKIKKRKLLKTGVKLFYESEGFIDLDQKDVLINPIKMVKNKKNKNDFDEKVNKDVIKSIVVSSEEILNQREPKNWAVINKGKVFRYKKDKNGLLNCID